MGFEQRWLMNIYSYFLVATRGFYPCLGEFYSMFVILHGSIPPLISYHDVYTSLHPGWTFLSMECSFFLDQRDF
jgi:hypothetical protein